MFGLFFRVLRDPLVEPGTLLRVLPRPEGELHRGLTLGAGTARRASDGGGAHADRTETLQHKAPAHVREVGVVAGNVLVCMFEPSGCQWRMAPSGRRRPRWREALETRLRVGPLQPCEILTPTWMVTTVHWRASLVSRRRLGGGNVVTACSLPTCSLSTQHGRWRTKQPELRDSSNSVCLCT